MDDEGSYFSENKMKKKSMESCQSGLEEKINHEEKNQTMNEEKMLK